MIRAEQSASAKALAEFPAPLAAPRSAPAKEAP